MPDSVYSLEIYFETLWSLFETCKVTGTTYWLPSAYVFYFSWITSLHLYTWQGNALDHMIWYLFVHFWKKVFLRFGKCSKITCHSSITFNYIGLKGTQVSSMLFSRRCWYLFSFVSIILLADRGDFSCVFF